MLSLVKNIVQYSRIYSRHFSFGLLGPRKLDELTNLPLLKVEDGKTVEKIWSEFHNEQENALGVSLSKDKCNQLLHRAGESPMFLYPVFKEEKYFMLISQFQDSYFFSTYLENYKQNPSTASPFLSCSIFQDFEEKKGVSLLRVDFLPEYIPKQVWMNSQKSIG